MIPFTLGDPMFIMNADGSNIRPVKAYPYPPLAQPGELPSWPPDENTIAFDWCNHCEEGLDISDIYVVDLATDTMKQPTFGEGYNDYPVGSSSAPVFSPDNEMIYFSSTRGDSTGLRSDVYSMDIDGCNVQRLTITPNGWSEVPSLSPDGKELAFVRADTLSNALPVPGTGGSNPMKMTDPPIGTNITLPRWSPNGKQIMFDAGGAIFVINADGSNLRKLSTDGIEAYQGDWNGK